jgi:hypothetical protein
VGSQTLAANRGKTKSREILISGCKEQMVCNNVNEKVQTVCSRLGTVSRLSFLVVSRGGSESDDSARTPARGSDEALPSISG